MFFADLTFVLYLPPRGRKFLSGNIPIMCIDALSPVVYHLYLGGVTAGGISQVQWRLYSETGFTAPSPFDKYEIRRRVRPVVHHAQTLWFQA